MPRFSVYALARSMNEQHNMNIGNAFAVAWYAQKGELPLADMVSSKLVEARIKSVQHYPVLDAGHVESFKEAYNNAFELVTGSN